MAGGPPAGGPRNHFFIPKERERPEETFFLPTLSPPRLMRVARRKGQKEKLRGRLVHFRNADERLVQQNP